ncbi:TIGR02449 family protein [Piscirickettsia litoralis]|uniref:TIGR02449 family protein n=1 Tax=Piscirickettsia litoralis TaxID=1891921 RepID=A0ABX3A5L4_9GAMM|nr:TIGR02449 family protein [Piscirickettsia litoralis]ODN42740.1 TIGR02449 family protein [Piscirickettsia litoralis]
MDELKLAALTRDIGKMIELCEQLKKENLALKTQKNALIKERSQLLDKNQVAKTRIESMLLRLEELEKANVKASA